MRRTTPFVLLAAIFLSLVARDAQALCMAPSLGAIMLTPLDADVPADGSLLVTITYGAVTTGMHASYAQGGFMLPPLELVQGGTRIAVRQNPLPGGLIRLDFARRPAPGAYTLAGWGAPGDAPTTVHIGGSLPLAPVAPALQRVTHTERHEDYQGPRGGGRMTHWRTHVALGRQLPAGNAFLVLREVGTTTGLQFFQALQDSALTETGSLGGRCAPGPVEGRSRVRVGAQVEAYVIDLFGRVSPASAPVQVR